MLSTADWLLLDGGLAQPAKSINTINNPALIRVSFPRPSFRLNSFEKKDGLNSPPIKQPNAVSISSMNTTYIANTSFFIWLEVVAVI